MHCEKVGATAVQKAGYHLVHLAKLWIDVHAISVSHKASLILGSNKDPLGDGTARLLAGGDALAK